MGSYIRIKLLSRTKATVAGTSGASGANLVIQATNKLSPMFVASSHCARNH